MKVALLGTRGAPARYGGFETAVEEIGTGLVERGHEVTVYCRGASKNGGYYRGMRRVVLPAIHRKALETFSHSAMSTVHALMHRPDVAIVFNAANAPFVLLLRLAGIRTILNIDGHDARRPKWNGFGKRYYRLATWAGLRLAGVVVVDSAAVQSELHAEFGGSSVWIPYGASTSISSVSETQAALTPAGLTAGGFHLLVARFEPENQVLEIVQSYAASDCALPLVVVGFAGFPSEYEAAINDVSDPRLIRLGALWDQRLLDALFAGCASYVHGHSMGGTNPSLLRAMVNGAPVIAFDCSYNRETTAGHAIWLEQARDAGKQMAEVEGDRVSATSVGSRLAARARSAYIWAEVVESYEQLFTSP